MRDWIITGPNGFREVRTATDSAHAIRRAFIMSDSISVEELMAQAGYRAEPIEEPKMVTVRADLLSDVRIVLEANCYPSMAEEIRAALDGAK